MIFDILYMFGERLGWFRLRCVLLVGSDQIASQAHCQGRNRPHFEQDPLDRRTLTGYIIGVGGRNPRASRSGEPLYRTARIVHQHQLLLRPVPAGKHHTTDASIWHDESTTAEEAPVRFGTLCAGTSVASTLASSRGNWSRSLPEHLTAPQTNPTALESLCPCHSRTFAPSSAPARMPHHQDRPPV